MGDGVKERGKGRRGLGSGEQMRQRWRGGVGCGALGSRGEGGFAKASKVESGALAEWA